MIFVNVLTNNNTYAILEPSISALIKRNKVRGFIFLATCTWYIIHVISRTTMQEGTIARVTDKGFGFINRAGEEKDLFFHSNDLVSVRFDELREGDKVTFEVAEGPKGLNAVNVNRV